MKAIHNGEFWEAMRAYVVLGVSKVLKMKAIHNSFLVCNMPSSVVLGVSKVLKMKAIHNDEAAIAYHGQLCSVCQRY